MNADKQFVFDRRSSAASNVLDARGGRERRRWRGAIA
jgi:hypothetical protein